MSHEFSIRRAVPEDERRIREIADSSYSLYLDRMDRKPFPMLDDYTAHIANGTIFVLEENCVICGYVVFLAGEANTLLLDNIAVDTSFQKRGYGRALVRFAEEEGRRRKLDAITLYTNEAMAENLKWYPKLGFQETGRRLDKGYKRVFFRKDL